MNNPRLIPLFGTGYSSEIPNYTENSGEGTIDVSKYEKIRINVPTGTPEDAISLEDFLALKEAEMLEDGKTYSIIL